MSTLTGKNVGNECRVDGRVGLNHMYRLSMLIRSFNVHRKDLFLQKKPFL